jgi:hypothetical protein
VTTGGSLYLIGDKVSRLERVGHAERSHGNSVRNTNSTELVADETGFVEGLLDALSKTQKVAVASENEDGCRRREKERSSGKKTINKVSKEMTGVSHGETHGFPSYLLTIQAIRQSVIAIPPLWRKSGAALAISP